MTEKKKILWLSDSPTTPTGYGTMTRKILNALSDEYECHCLAHNYLGVTLAPPIMFEDGEEIKFHLHGSGRAKYSMDMVTPLIRDLEIDAFGILLDTFMAMEAQFLNVDTSPAHTFFYYPSDGGGGLPQSCDNILKKVEFPISMSKFGKEQVEKAHGIKSLYIPHAFDPKTFFPLSKEEKEALRIKWMLRNKFVVGSVFRNQGRKAADRLLKAFKKFSEDKPDALLLLHCDPNDVAQQFNMNNIISRYKMNNRVLFTGMTFYKPFDYTEMNDVYNLMDIFALSTTGEGFGVPTIEAMACGIPQVVTNYTTTYELLTEEIQTGIPVKLVGEDELIDTPHIDELRNGTIIGGWEVERAFWDIDDAVEAMNKLYYDKKLYAKLSKNSIEKANKYYTWDIVIQEWKKFFKEILK